MSIEQVGPGGVSNSYGARTTSPKEVYDNTKQYEDVSIPKGTIPLTATISDGGIGFDAETSAAIQKAAATPQVASFGSSVFDFSTLAGVSITAGGVIELVDAATPRIFKPAGSKSLKVTVPAGTTKALTVPIRADQVCPTSCYKFVVEQVSPDLLTTGAVLVGNDSNFTNHYYANIAFDKHGLYTIDPSNFAVGGGSPTITTGVKYCRLNIVAQPGQDFVCVFHGMYASPAQKPAVQIIFDDGWRSDYTEVLPLLNKYGLRAGFSIIKNLVGGANFLTWGMIDEIYASGHDIYTHGEFALSSFSTVEEAMADVSLNRASLISRGYTRGSDIYVYPQGAWSLNATDRTSIVAALQDLGYRSAYLASGGAASIIGGVDLMRINRRAINASVGAATVLISVDSTISAKKEITLMGHQILSTGATGDATNRQVLDDIFAGLATRIAAGSIVNRCASERAIS